MSEEAKTPNLIMFNTVTGFREAVSFIGESGESPGSKIHIETFSNEEEDGLVYMRITTDTGFSVLIDSTLKSQCLDSDAYVRLQDFFVMCDKGVKDGLVAMWVSGGRIYVGSSFNESLQCFESEASLPLLDPFEINLDFTPDETIQVEQMIVGSVLETCYNFEKVELVRTEGTFSIRTGDERVCIATLPTKIGQLGVQDREKLKDFAIAVPSNVFKCFSYVTPADSNMMPYCTIDFDWERKKLRVAGRLYSIVYSYSEGKLRTGTTEGMKPYMKFDTIGMMATIDMVYGLNYLDPTAPVKLTPIDEKTVEMRYSYDEVKEEVVQRAKSKTKKKTKVNRYSGVITMSGVLMSDTEKSLTLPMDVSTMMVRYAATAVLEMLYSEDGRIFMTFSCPKFSRKCMYFGG